MSQEHTRYTLSTAAVAALEAGNPAALIASHRPAFGGFTMEATGADAGTDGGDTGDQGTDGTEGTDDGADGTDETDDDGTEDDRVKRANRQAANYRTQLRQTEGQVAELTQKLTEQGDTLAKLAAVFNPEGDSSADPAEQLQQITGEAQTLRSRVSELEAELLVHTLAGDNNANPVALLDSRDFTRTLHGLDPAAADYREQVSQAIATAVEKNDRYAAQGQGPSRGGADGAGQGPSTPGSVTQEQFNAMSYGDKAELFKTNPALYNRLSGRA